MRFLEARRGRGRPPRGILHLTGKDESFVKIRLPKFARTIGSLTLAAMFASSVGADGTKGPKTPLDTAKERISPVHTDHKKIINGNYAGLGAFPFQVSLILAGAKKGEELNDHYCGGSLISDTWVLTAGHCVTAGGNVDDPKNINVYVGSVNFKNGDRIPVRSIYRHPDYDNSSLDNDVALLQLERAPKKEVKVGKINVFDAASDSALEMPGTELTVVGWGYTSGEGAPSKILRYASITMVDRNECGDNIARNRAKDLDDSEPMLEIIRQFRINEGKIGIVHDAIVANAGFVNDHMICAGDPKPPPGAETVRDACNGDSGGPLIAKLGDKLIQVGIVSWGEGCGIPKLYGVYTRLSTYVDWIKSTIAN
jgi:secreted trypsin-like serine protease